MMDYQALNTEIGLPAYVGMSDEQIVTALNASTIAVTNDIQINDLEGLLLLQKLLPELEDYALTGADAAGISAAKALTGLVSSTRLTIVQTSVPQVMTVFTGFVGDLLDAGQLTQDQHDEVLGLAVGTISRAQQLLGHSVTVGNIQTARAQ